MERVLNPCARVVSNYYYDYYHMLETPKTLSTRHSGEGFTPPTGGRQLGMSVTTLKVHDGQLAGNPQIYNYPP
jgi:hypothetical protein